MAVKKTKVNKSKKYIKNKKTSTLKNQENINKVKVTDENIPTYESIFPNKDTEIKTSKTLKKESKKTDKILDKNQELTKEIEQESVTKKEREHPYLSAIILVTVNIILITITIIILNIPKIKLIGDSNITITYKDNYQEPGYNAKNYYQDLTDKVKVKSTLELNKIGTYQTTYYLKKWGITFKNNRIIKIIDQDKPTINIDSSELKLCPNQEIPQINYQAFDEYDGDLTNKIIKTVNDNEIILKVSDSSNNYTETKINIIREDTEKPIINLHGNQIMFLEFGSPYYEPGYTVTDNCSEHLEDKVKVIGTVGRDIGTYQLTYEVTDENGNKTSVERKVIVGTKIYDNGTITNGSIYLTFDDGPSEGSTDRILNILKEENVQATFFVTGRGPDYLIKRIVDEGHQIALHTNNHEYSYIYSSTSNYFNDLNQINDRVKRITGIDSKIIRFPGGSSNTVSRSYKYGIMTELSNLVLNQGYRYYDWNVDSMDAGGARNSNDVFYNVTTHLSPNRANMVLMHDIKWITADALKDIIKYGKNNNYTFKKIDMNTYMIRHGINN